MTFRFVFLRLSLAVMLSVTGCSTTSGIFALLTDNIGHPEPPPAGTVNVFSPNTRLSALWVGHATVLLQMDDRMIITDPFLTDHVSMLKMRQVAPGVVVDSIPRLDLILISHSHSDHCNLGSLRTLERRFPDAHLVFPEGVEEFLPRFTFPMDRLKMSAEDSVSVIGETRTIAGMTVTTVRSYHWGGRYGLDGVLWDNGGYTGFIIQYQGLTVYFAGDTGYDPQTFARIGQLFKIDLACIPIGPATIPDSIGSPVHVYPLGALRIFDDLHARFMLPIHYGTTADPWDENSPGEVLQAILRDRPDMRSRVFLPQIGEQVVVTGDDGEMAKK
jgi:N-acyl-phosphatidylethanolamine-hydrolysing phospholipase D